jgi:exonuclease SbcC
MRLTSLDVSGFRAFSGHETVDLDADAVVVVGANGQGKTSLFDAALWALTGRIVRLGPSGSVVSLFSSAGEARVALSLRESDGGQLTAIRSTDGSNERFSLESNGETIRGAAATAMLLDRLWPQGRAATKPEDALKSAFERGVYLQQDLVRSFIDAVSDRERFEAIGELVGAGRINELQTALERSRVAWSRATNVRADEAKQLEARIVTLQDQLERLSGRDIVPSVDAGLWTKWWDDAHRSGISVSPSASPHAHGAGELLDAAVKELQAIALDSGRARQDASSLLEQVSALPPEPQEDLATLQAAVAEASAAVDAARGDLTLAEEQASALRRAQVQTQEAKEELRALAQIALRHLGERCPVCDQEYDREKTIRRLERAVLDETGDADQEPLPDVSGLAARVEQREQEAVRAARAASEAAQRMREWEALRGSIARQADALGLGAAPVDQWEGALKARLDAIDQRLASVTRLRQAGEQLALGLARDSEMSRRTELERGCPGRRGTLGRRSWCDGYMVMAMAASRVGAVVTV